MKKGRRKGIYILGIFSLFIAISLILAACQGGVAPKSRTFDIMMGEGKVLAEEPLVDLGVEDESVVGEFHRWEPDTIVVFKGDTVALNVSNPHEDIHSLIISDFGVNTGPLDQDSGVKTVKFTADKAGTFRFECGTEPDPNADPRECAPDHPQQVGYLIVLDR
ncbi:MAG: cupredoxin domain-containing protein [Actinobacteria bacterium]|nr:cupredoxin domain-containing protein [Actinomycetota bacterium]